MKLNETQRPIVAAMLNQEFERLCIKEVELMQRLENNRTRQGIIKSDIKQILSDGSYDTCGDEI